MAGTTRNVKRQWSIQPNLDSNSFEDATLVAFEELNKVITDLETLRGVVQAGGVLIANEMRANNDLTRTWQTEVDADLDEMNDYVHKEFERDGVVGGGYALSIGSVASTDLKINGSIRFRIDGREYVSDADLEVTLATGEVTGDKWGAWAIEISKKGVLTTKRATSGVMAFDNEQDALLSLAAIARTSGAIDIAYLTIDAASGGFTPGTDDPNASDATVDNHGYRIVAVPRLDNGLVAAMGSGFVTGTVPEEYAYGTQDIRVNALEPTQLAADTTRPFDDADTIGNTQFGGWLLVSDLAGTAVYALGSDGIAGTASVMTHATAAAADTQLDVIMARLPSVFVILSRLVITNNLGGTWTAITDDLNGTDGTAVFTDRSFGTYDRTLSSEDDTLVDSPVVPATVTAPVVPAAVAAAASTTAVDAAGDMTAATIATAESGD